MVETSLCCCKTKNCESLLEFMYILTQPACVNHTYSDSASPVVPMSVEATDYGMAQRRLMRPPVNGLMKTLVHNNACGHNNHPFESHSQSCTCARDAGDIYRYRNPTCGDRMVNRGLADVGIWRHTIRTMITEIPHKTHPEKCSIIIIGNTF